mmetsp:Transcript_26050/g.73614  ORF Transcript_26050/g.73614 Transcript_26050/m.73614 type:complete len:681 (+) Transcript_26050:425-2467(+)
MQQAEEEDREPVRRRPEPVGHVREDDAAYELRGVRLPRAAHLRRQAALGGGPRLEQGEEHLLEALLPHREGHLFPGQGQLRAAFQKQALQVDERLRGDLLRPLVGEVGEGVERGDPEGLPLAVLQRQAPRAPGELGHQAGEVLQRRGGRRGAVLLREGLQGLEELRELLQREQPRQLLVVAEPVYHALDAGCRGPGADGEVGDPLEQREDGAQAAVGQVRLLHQDEEPAGDSLGVRGEEPVRQPRQVLGQGQQRGDKLSVADEPDAQPQRVHDEPLDELLLGAAAAGDHVLQQPLEVRADERPDLRHALVRPERHARHVGQELEAEDGVGHLVPPDGGLDALRAGHGRLGARRRGGGTAPGADSARRGRPLRRARQPHERLGEDLEALRGELLDARGGEELDEAGPGNKLLHLLVHRRGVGGGHRQGPPGARLGFLPEEVAQEAVAAGGPARALLLVLVLVACLVLEPAGEALEEAVAGVLLPGDADLLGGPPVAAGARRRLRVGLARRGRGERRPQGAQALQRLPVGAREVVEVGQVQRQEIQRPQLQEHVEDGAPLGLAEERRVLRHALRRGVQSDLGPHRQRFRDRTPGEVLAHHPHEAVHRVGLVEVGADLREVLEAGHRLRRDGDVGHGLVAERERRQRGAVHHHLEHVALGRPGRRLGQQPLRGAELVDALAAA